MYENMDPISVEYPHHNLKIKSQSVIEAEQQEYLENSPIQQPSVDMKVNTKPFSECYELGKEMGSGQFAVVYRCISRKTGEKFAAKFIKKRRYATSRRGVSRNHIEREVEVLRAIGGHENVIELKDVFETPNEVILVLEVVSGGELFDHVCSKEKLEEKEASEFVKQILYGVRHLHNKYVVHLDIKPENIMLKEKNSPKIKLIDFGLSRFIHPRIVVRDMIGTPEFVAPEVVNYEPLSSATDMWALGVVTYILLSGGSPFLGRTREETFCNITSVNYHFAEPYFRNVSQLAKDFISRLFVKDVFSRATVDDCLNHPWIKGPEVGIDDIRISSIIPVSKIHGFKVKMRWRRAIDIIVICCILTKKVRNEIKIAAKKGYTIETRYNKDDLITSAILIACEEGNLAALEQLSDIHRLSLLVSNEHGETPMHIAAGCGYEQIICFLQSKGAFLDAPDRRGDTPLFWAARNGHANIVHLIGNQVAINTKNKNSETSLHLATRYAQVTSVLSLLEKGANIDIVDEHGETPLHIASWHGYTLLLSILCRFGPTLDLKNADDETALHCAAARGHIECVQCLVESGANVDSQDQNGQTALHLALRRSHIDIALYLISKECDMNIKDINEDTPLHVACRLGLNSVVQMLCHLGADVDCMNSNNDTPLHIAAKEGHIEIVRCLCFVGANIQAKNKDGLTAEILAITNEHQNISQLLNKVKNETQRLSYVDQLCNAEMPLRRIKLKVFGNSQSGKSKLVQGLQGHGVIGNIINAVSRRFSDNSPSKNNSDEGIHSCASSSTSSDSNYMWQTNYHRPTHQQYTRGIDVQTITVNNTGDEFSVWEFGGYESYHIAYDHFVGNTDCIHIITIRADEPTEIQYRQALYWMNFLKGRVTPSEPIGHRGIIARRSKVVIVATNASQILLTTANGFEKQADGNFTNSDAEAMMKTIRLRFESHFDVYEKLIFVDSTQSSCNGMKIFKNYLQETRAELLNRLQRPLILLDSCINYLSTLRKRFSNFPVITWFHFTTLIREEVNPLASDSHCQQLIHQLQLIGEVVYLRDETAEIDYVVITPEWLSTHIIGTILSAEFLSHCRESGCYSADNFTSTFPEVAEPSDLINILDTLHLCSPIDQQNSEHATIFEFPAFLLTEPPRDIWTKDKQNYVYGGMKILPMRGMESTLQSTFPRIQVALRNQIHDYRDPTEVSLQQYQGLSKLVSNKMEALVRLNGDAVEIQVRGPQKMATSCIYFLEDVANVVEQTTTEIAPGMSLERHFLSPKHLKEHISNPANFPPEVIMAMQQRESLSIVNSDGEEELFTDVVCFGSREVAAMLTLGVDMSVSQLTMPSRCELAALLDPPDAMGRDWSILAVKLNLTETLPEVDSTGQSISQTDQLIAEWAIKCPETATVGKFCSILEEMGRLDARDALYRTVPLYLFAPLDETSLLPPMQLSSQRDTTTSMADSGVLLSSAPRSSSTTLSN